MTDNDHYRYDPYAGEDGEGAIIKLNGTEYSRLRFPNLKRAKEEYRELGEAIREAEEGGHVNDE